LLSPENPERAVKAEERNLINALLSQRLFPSDNSREWDGPSLADEASLERQARPKANTANCDGREAEIERIRLSGIHVVGVALEAIVCRVVARVLSLEILEVM